MINQIQKIKIDFCSLPLHGIKIACQMPMYINRKIAQHVDDKNRVAYHGVLVRTSKAKASQ